jgi:predicted nucleic acid-binding protein
VSYLLDTSILGRLANATDAQHAVAADAILELHRRKESLYITAQNLIEFRNMATRPLSANGLGLTPSVAGARAAKIEADFPLLPETPDIFPAWKALVAAAGTIGKQVHDARLVAICHAHRVTHLLTFNIGHFTALGKFPPGVVVVDPTTL